MALILVVDDKPSMRKMLASALQVQGHKTVLASSGTEALLAVKKESFDLVLTDVRMPDISGMDVLREVRARQRDTAVIVMTAFGTVETAVEAMKMGAADYLTKPFSLDQLKVAVDKSLNLVSLKAENQALKAQVHDMYDFQGVLGESSAMHKVHQLIRKVAAVDSAVLIQGESGTGKELVAHAIHANSRRKGGPFLKVNCAALPEGLLESELFGHEKGAFTGAHERRLGRFELSNGGTLFLDEVGEIPLGSQVKLLRVLQEKEYERLGGSLPIRTDVRVIAASNSDLKSRISQKLFREDLFFRLNVVPVFLPPLRERMEDIPPLAQHFLKKHLQEVRPAGPIRIAGETLKALKRYPFPGNVRELENIIQRAMVLVDKEGTILPRHLPKEVLEHSHGHTQTGIKEDGGRFSSQVDSFQRTLILEALEKSGGSQTQAAQQLGINRTLLIYKMKKYGIDGDSFKRNKK